MAASELNLDRLLKDIRAENLKITLFEEEFEVPHVIPMAFGLAQLEFAEIDDPSARDVYNLEITLLSCIFGNDRVQNWINNGHSRDELNFALTQTLRAIAGDSDDDSGVDASGKAPALN